MPTKLQPHCDIQLFVLFLDCEGSLCGPHSVWQERCSLRCRQQTRQPKVEHGKGTRTLTWSKRMNQIFHMSLMVEPVVLSQVDVQYQRMLKRFLPLSELKKHHLQQRAKGGPLKDMALFTRARLSVQPLTTGRSRNVHFITVIHYELMDQLWTWSVFVSYRGVWLCPEFGGRGAAVKLEPGWPSVQCLC